MEEYSKTLKDRRLEKDVTQDVVAEAIGVTRAYYGMIEKGERKPSFDVMEKIADYFEITFNEIGKIMKNGKK